MQTFQHKAQVEICRLLLGVMKDGRKVVFDDWSQTGTIRATKRTWVRNGFQLVRMADGSEKEVRIEHLRLAA